jgi:hypothetical protein
MHGLQESRNLVWADPIIYSDAPAPIKILEFFTGNLEIILAHRLARLGLARIWLFKASRGALLAMPYRSLSKTSLRDAYFRRGRG